MSHPPTGSTRIRVSRRALGALAVLALGYACTATVIEELPGRVGSERPPRVGPTEDQPPPRDRVPDRDPDTSPPPTDEDAGTEPPPPPPPLDPIPTAECGSPLEQQELVLTNAARASNGLSPLECDVGLTLAARKHSEDMCALGYFSHTSYDGRQFDQRMREEGVSFGAAAENIAMGQETAEWVHESWMRSSGHRRNILDGTYRRIGIGHAPCASGALWTQDFAD